MPAWVQWISAVGALLGIGGAGLSPFLIRAQIKKFKGEGSLSEASAAKTLSDGARDLLKPAIERAIQLNGELEVLRNQLFAMTVELAKANANLATAQSEIAGLRDQMDKMSKELVAKTVEIERLTGGNYGITS